MNPKSDEQLFLENKKFYLEMKRNYFKMKSEFFTNPNEDKEILLDNGWNIIKDLFKGYD